MSIAVVYGQHIAETSITEKVALLLRNRFHNIAFERVEGYPYFPDEINFLQHFGHLFYDTPEFRAYKDCYKWFRDLAREKRGKFSREYAQILQRYPIVVNLHAGNTVGLGVSGVVISYNKRLSQLSGIFTDQKEDDVLEVKEFKKNYYGNELYAKTGALVEVIPSFSYTCVEKFIQLFRLTWNGAVCACNGLRDIQLRELLSEQDLVDSIIDSREKAVEHASEITDKLVLTPLEEKLKSFTGSQSQPSITSSS